MQAAPPVPHCALFCIPPVVPQVRTQLPPVPTHPFAPQPVPASFPLPASLFGFWQCPFTQLCAPVHAGLQPVDTAVQMPPWQNCPLVQATHAAALPPHALFVVPLWHSPVKSQHPDGQLESEHLLPEQSDNIAAANRVTAIPSA
jgi:hypothetical protein